MQLYKKREVEIYANMADENCVKLARVKQFQAISESFVTEQTGSAGRPTINIWIYLENHNLVEMNDKLTSSQLFRVELYM